MHLAPHHDDRVCGETVRMRIATVWFLTRFHAVFSSGANKMGEHRWQDSQSCFALLPRDVRYMLARALRKIDADFSQIFRKLDAITDELRSPIGAVVIARTLSVPSDVADRATTVLHAKLLELLRVRSDGSTIGARPRRRPSLLQYVPCKGTKSIAQRFVRDSRVTVQFSVAGRKCCKQS